MRTTPRRFTESEDGFISSNYHSMLARDIASHLDRGVQQIRKRAGKLGLAHPLKRWCDEEDAVIRDGWGKRMLADVARELDRRVSEVSTRAKALGCSPWRIRKGTHAGRPIDGFASGKPIYSHRTVVEKRIGRSLRSDEIVHHIDADKSNNASSNLYVFKSRSAHRKAHSTFESIIPSLLELGVIEFDRHRGIYRLCEINK